MRLYGTPFVLRGGRFYGSTKALPYGDEISVFVGRRFASRGGIAYFVGKDLRVRSG